MSNPGKPIVQFRPIVRQQPINWPLTLRKIGLSLLVAGGFAAYAIQERASGTNAAAADSASAGSNGANPVSANAAASQATNTPAVNNHYADGTYTGSSVDAYYGYVQVQATVQGGKITDVQFLDYPRDRRTSAMINSYAMPRLISEAIYSQTAQVDVITGATFTSQAFDQSLQNALQQAHG